MDQTTTRTVSAVLDGAPYATKVTTRGLHWLADEPTDHGGTDLGPRPHEMLLGGLASCTAITMRMYADRKQWNVGRIGVHVTMERTQRGAEIETRIHMDIDLDPALPEDQRQRLAQIARSCPVHRTLENPIHLSSGLRGPGTAG